MTKTDSRKGYAANLGLAALLVCAAAGERTNIHAKLAGGAARNTLDTSADEPEAIVKRWAPRPRNAAQLMLDKYGRPDQFDQNILAWFNKGEWKRTVVRRNGALRFPFKKNSDYLEQSLGYLVPSDKIDDLKRFSPIIDASMTAGELTFASEDESKNRLALNLANDIVTGKRGPVDSRAFYLKTIRLAASGKSYSYLDALLYKVDNTRYMIATGADR